MLSLLSRVLNRLIGNSNGEITKENLLKSSQGWFGYAKCANT